MGVPPWIESRQRHFDFGTAVFLIGRDAFLPVIVSDEEVRSRDKRSVGVSFEGRICKCKSEGFAELKSFQCRDGGLRVSGQIS